MLPIALIKLIAQGQSAQSLVQCARELAASNASSSELFAAVAGVSLTHSSTLADGTQLIPWDEVPDCHQKKAFDPATDATSFGHFPARPTVAIKVHLGTRRILFAAAQEVSLDELRSYGARIEATYAKVFDGLRLLTVASGAPVGIVGSWVHLNNDIARFVAGGGHSRGEDRFDRTLFWASLKPVETSWTAVSKLSHDFAKFKKNDQRVLRIAADRIGSALREPKIADKAIDLGIALETVLLHDQSSERTELKFRAAIRGSAFVGGDRGRRIETLKLLKAAYDHRSTAVHSGELTKPNAAAEIDAALAIGVSIIRQIIELARFPSWDEDYVIGGTRKPWQPFLARQRSGAMARLAVKGAGASRLVARARAHRSSNV